MEQSLKISNVVYSGVPDFERRQNMALDFGVPDVDRDLNVSPVVPFGVPDVAVISLVCRGPIPFLSEFLRVEQSLKIFVGVHFGVLDVEGGLNISLAVAYRVLDVAVIPGVCHRLIPLYSQFLCVDQDLETSAGVHSGASRIDGGLKDSLVDYGVPDVAVIPGVCYRLIPLYSHFLCGDRGLEISVDVHSGVLGFDRILNASPDVHFEVSDDGDLNASPVVHFGVPDAAVISRVCRRPIPLRS